MTSTSLCSPRFRHGRLFLTSGIVAQAREGKINVLQSLERHLACDWGDASEARKEMNDAAVESRGALISRYQTPSSTPIIIVTNEDRSLTKVMLQDEFLDDTSDLPTNIASQLLP